MHNLLFKKNRPVFLILFGVLFLFLPKISSAADWYVDKEASGLDNGTSWADAWKAFSDISWSTIEPGDTIYISGGDISKTYNERLKIQASGSSDSDRVTIMTGQDAGHNGTVIITPPEWDGINISDQSYVTVSGQVGTEQKMRVTGGLSSGIGIEGASSHIQLLYLELDNNGAGDPNSGIEIWINIASIGIEIGYSYIHDNYQDGIHWGESVRGSGYGNNFVHHNIITNTHDDGIEIGASSVDFYNNVMGNNIAPERGHPDGIQAYGWYYRIYNNYFHGFKDQAGNAVIYIEPDDGDPGFSPFGHVQIFNNLFYEDGNGIWANGAICIAISGDTFQTVSDIKILNNTIVGHSLALLLAFTGVNLGGSGVSDYYVENNIIYNGDILYDIGDMPVDFISYGNYGDSASVIIDYNDFYNTGYNGGANLHGITSDPELDLNQRPQAGSPIINTGYGWASLFTTDKDGVVRPQGLAWDIGAYEYVGAADVVPPSAPTGVMVQ
jgi:ribosomal protein L24